MADLLLRAYSMAIWKWIRVRCLHVSALGRLWAALWIGGEEGREWMAISPNWYSSSSSLELAHGDEVLM
ncbi:hypothetical protein ACS0TY_019963 [Phlomoides rotata]